MKLLLTLICLAVFAAVFAPPRAAAFLPEAEKNAPAFAFADVKYFHRFTSNDQHEYTPAGQADLNVWADMMTINWYRKTKDGDALAAMANGVLENYKAHQGTVVKTSSVPRTKDKPAEHLIVVAFRRPTFTEVAFARFKLHQGVGASAVYSHRTYGKKSWEEMNAWLVKNGPGIEQQLMGWAALPALQ